MPVAEKKHPSGGRVAPVEDETSDQAKQDRYVLWKAQQRVGPGVLLWRGNLSDEEWMADIRQRIRRDRRSSKELWSAQLREYRAYYGLDPVTGKRPDAGWDIAVFCAFVLLVGGIFLVALL